MNVNLLVFAALIGLSPICAGQETSQLADQPVCIVRFNGWSQEGFAEYIRELSQDLQVGTRMAEAFDKQAKKIVTTTVEAPTSGFLVYMQRGLIPSAEQIQYSEVASRDEFEKLVQAQKAMMGDSSVVEGSDDKYKLVRTTITRVEIPDETKAVTASDDDSGISVKQVSASTPDAPASETQDVDIPEGQQTTLMIGPFGFSSSSTDSDGRIVEENGRRFRDTSFTVSNYYRYHDGFMFSGTTAMLWDMNLPSSALLRDENDAELNGQVSFYPDRIPMGFRQLGWDLLNAGIGTELQQHDDEPEVDYAWRRAYGKAGLGLVKATMFDTQEITGWLKFARDDEPIRGELKIASRANSGLGKTLLGYASADSRFAPILNDSAAATLHVAVNLPNDWKEAAAAFRESYAAEINADPDEASPAMLDFLHSATSCSEHGTLEALLKLGWSEESGGVVYGGLHVDENPDLLNSLLKMMGPEAFGAPLELIQKGDLQLLSITIPDGDLVGFLKLGHVYFAHADSCLWFAVGGENAHEMIRMAIERCRETGGRLRTPLLTATVDFERLLAYPQDDATGLTAITQICAQTMEMFVREYGSFAADEDPSGMESDLSFRALQLGGSKKISLTLAADESGMVLSGTLGTALLRSWLAPSVEMLDQMATIAPSTAVPMPQ